MKVLYCLSGDPIHFGHISTIERASKMFEHVFIGIGVNADKKGLFSLGERVTFARRAMSHLPNVSVDFFEGLAVDYARTIGASVLLRSARSANDFVYEQSLSQINYDLDSNLETILLPAREHQYVSSSMLKAVVKEYGDVSAYTPLFIKRALEEKIHEQHLVGLTGEMGMGKSYVGRYLTTLSGKYRVNIYHIELDDIAHDVLGGSKFLTYNDEASNQARLQILEIFGTLNRAELAEQVFSSKEKMNRFNEIMSVPVMLHLREQLRHKKGLVFINCASLVEWNLHKLCNNNVLFITCKHQTRISRLKTIRQISEEKFLAIQKAQQSTRGKIEILRKAMKRDKCGTLWITGNNTNDLKGIKNLLKCILERFNLD